MGYVLCNKHYESFIPINRQKFFCMLCRNFIIKPLLLYLKQSKHRFTYYIQHNNIFRFQIITEKPKFIIKNKVSLFLNPLLFFTYLEY